MQMVPYTLYQKNLQQKFFVNFINFRSFANIYSENFFDQQATIINNPICVGVVLCYTTFTKLFFLRILQFTNFRKKFTTKLFLHTCTLLSTIPGLVFSVQLCSQGAMTPYFMYMYNKCIFTNNPLKQFPMVIAHTMAMLNKFVGFF